MVLDISASAATDRTETAEPVPEHHPPHRFDNRLPTRRGPTILGTNRTSRRRIRSTRHRQGNITGLSIHPTGATRRGRFTPHGRIGSHMVESPVCGRIGSKGSTYRRIGRPGRRPKNQDADSSSANPRVAAALMGLTYLTGPLRTVHRLLHGLRTPPSRRSRNSVGLCQRGLRPCAAPSRASDKRMGWTSGTATSDPVGLGLAGTWPVAAVVFDWESGTGRAASFIQSSTCWRSPSSSRPPEGRRQSRRGAKWQRGWGCSP